MLAKKETTYTIVLTEEEIHQLIAEMNSIYPLFASEGDVKDIDFLLRLKNKLAILSQE